MAKKKNKYFPLIQLALGAIGGVVLLIAGAFVGSWLAPGDTYSKVTFVAFGILFGYLLGVFLGVYLTGRLRKKQGSFWLTLGGGFLSVIAIVLLNEQIALNDSSIFIWLLLLIIFPALQTWGYYRFTIGKKIKIV